MIALGGVIILDSHGRIFLTRISSPEHRLTSHPIPLVAGAHDTKGPITNHTFRVIGALQKTAGFSTGFPTPAVSHRGGWLVGVSVFGTPMGW